MTLTEEVDGFVVTVGALLEVLVEADKDRADFVEETGGGGGMFDDVLIVMLDEPLIVILDDVMGAATRAKFCDIWTWFPF